MRPSACVGRVGGLAVALGIGAAVFVGYPGPASATPADDATTVSSAEGDTTAAPRSRRPAKPKAAGPQRNNTGPAAARVTVAPKTSSGPIAVDRVQLPAEAVTAAPAAVPSASPTAAVFTAAAPVASAAIRASLPVAAPATMATATALSAGAVALTDLSGGGAPVQGPLGWVVYAAAVRRPAASKTASATPANPILSFFFNQTPTANPSRGPQSATAAINGGVDVTDDDSDVITYTVLTQPARGMVSIDAAGNYTYTPNADLVATGGLDSFQVQASDAESGFHLHGIMGLINLLTFGLIGDAGHTVTTTINLSVLAATTSSGTPSPSTGVLTGNVTASGAAGDQFTYSGSTTSKGVVDVDASGAFTYTPNYAARHAAAKLDAPASAKTDTFTIGIADSLGGAMTVPVTTVITPANVAPTATQGESVTNVTSGVVAGAVIGSDADGDPLSYALSTTAAKGTAVVNINGGFTYTPTALARHNAAFNADTADAFTVTVTDGYGGSVDVPVSVVISPASVTFDWVQGSGSQYWTAANLAALNTAATRLSSYIVVGTPIVITTTLIGQNNPGSNFLASSYTNFVSGNPGYYGTVVQTKILTGTDANGAAADSQLTWNFAYPWALGDSVPGNQYDFQSVAMHEIVHSLGFLSGIGSPNAIDTNWATYDSFLSTSTGTAVIDPNYSFNTAYTTNLTGGNGGLYFNGTNAVAVYGGPVPLYTPGTWTSGSSVTHLRASPVKPTGTTAYLMDPSDGYGLGVRVITPVDAGILKDLGYTIVTPSSASVFFIFGLGLIRRRRESR